MYTFLKRVTRKLNLKVRAPNSFRSLEYSQEQRYWVQHSFVSEQVEKHPTEIIWGGPQVELIAALLLCPRSDLDLSAGKLFQVC